MTVTLIIKNSTSLAVQLKCIYINLSSRDQYNYKTKSHLFFGVCQYPAVLSLAYLHDCDNS